MGVVINNTATFKHHVYGDEENKGLLKQLSSRVGILKKLSKNLPLARLKLIYDGLFNSKLVYGITVWGRVWQIPGSLDEDLASRTSSSITKEDVRKMQVLQNKCLRLVTDSDYRTPTSILLQKTNSLSVHQLMAHLSLTQVYGIHKSKLPPYHYKRLFGTAQRIEFNLSQARSNFFYQSSRLWTALPEDIKASRDKCAFKKSCKKWVRSNILIKP